MQHTWDRFPDVLSLDIVDTVVLTESLFEKVYFREGNIYCYLLLPPANEVAGR